MFTMKPLVEIRKTRFQTSNNLPRSRKLKRYKTIIIGIIFQSILRTNATSLATPASILETETSSRISSGDSISSRRVPIDFASLEAIAVENEAVVLTVRDLDDSEAILKIGKDAILPLYHLPHVYRYGSIYSRAPVSTLFCQ
jgi:hypothetical protein